MIASTSHLTLFRVKQSRMILARALVSIVLAGFIVPNAAKADVIADRKTNFKASAASMKAIAAAISGGDTATVIQRANSIAAWAQQIPAHFPKGSDQGDTKARAEIWLDFDKFIAAATTNKNAALMLVESAESGDPGAMMAGLKNLGASCKACHSAFKE